MNMQVAYDIKIQARALDEMLAGILEVEAAQAKSDRGLSIATP